MKATARFDIGWNETLTGDLEQGGELSVEYDLNRLPQHRTRYRDAAVWDIIALARFHPDGQILAASVTAPVYGSPGGATVDRAPAVATFPVPGDAGEVEMWFLNLGYGFSSEPPKAWDSRFGQNYRFAVRAAPAVQTVALRPDAETSRDVVNAARLVVEKLRHQFAPPPALSAGSEMRTAVRLRAWVKNVTYEKSVWFDAHVFDGENRLVHAQTLPLHHKADGGGGGDLFEFDDVFYVGSRGQPGSVSPRPDARRLQLRLYCELGGRVFTDGILHDRRLPEDARVP
jgi:hypothetical protein